MGSETRRLPFLADASLGIVVIYGSVWVYEAGNFLVIYALGGGPHLEVFNFLPTGVIARAMSMGVLAKTLQLIVVMGPFLGVLRLLWNTPAPIVKLALLFGLCCYLSSTLWEGIATSEAGLVVPMASFSIMTTGIFLLVLVPFHERILT